MTELQTDGRTNSGGERDRKTDRWTEKQILQEDRQVLKLNC